MPRERLARFEKEIQGKYFADVRLTPASPDVRPVWEPGRLQHISGALARLQTKDQYDDSAAIRRFAREAVLHWISEKHFLYGPKYMSAMECGLRIPVLLYCLRQLDNLPPDESRLQIRSIWEQTWWVSKRLSLYSSLGNHNIAESVGLIFGGAVFRGGREGRAWVDKGLELLKEEVLLARLGISVNHGDWPLPVLAVDIRYLADLQMSSLDVHATADAIEGLLRGAQ